jgi:3',5'-cyclic AMP phosphodiesterase CpdA
MKILHIGDLHYKLKKNTYDQDLAISKLLEKLNQRSDIDFVFFTGDLVHNGSHVDAFTEANEKLFQSLKKNLSLADDRIFICPGNHDIDRNVCSEALIFFIDNNIKTNEELNDFYEKRNSDLIL